MQIILASQSPRRKELLGLFHLPFTVRAADIDETMDPSLSPCQAVAAVCEKKAAAVAALHPDSLIVSADTVVVVDHQILGKPKNPDDAARMLRLLSGRDHQVMTGMTVLKGDACRTVTEVTDLHFRPLSRREIESYVRSGEPMDKAGSYGIQGGAALFCEKMSGDYYNVMGLPVCRLGEILRELAPECLEDTL